MIATFIMTIFNNIQIDCTIHYANFNILQRITGVYFVHY